MIPPILKLTACMLATPVIIFSVADITASTLPFPAAGSLIVATGLFWTIWLLRTFGGIRLRGKAKQESQKV